MQDVRGPVLRDDGASADDRESTPPVRVIQSENFRWTGRDVSDAGLVAFALGLARRADHGDAVMESSIELQTRPPRIADAWRFFHAARLLARDSVMAATAHQLGARIALEATGWLVLDVNQIEAGATVEHVLTVHPGMVRTRRVPACACTDEHGNRDCAAHGGRAFTGWVLTTGGRAIRLLPDSDAAGAK